MYLLCTQYLLFIKNLLLINIITCTKVNRYIFVIILLLTFQVMYEFTNYV